MRAVKDKRDIPLRERTPDPAEPPLTVEEERAFETGRRNAKRGDCLTLDEFLEQVSLR